MGKVWGRSDREDHGSGGMKAGKNAMMKKDLEKDAMSAFQSNPIYYEGIKTHHSESIDGANIEDDVKKLILDNLKGNVLDAGGGEGSISNWMARHNSDAQVYSVDISPIGVRMGQTLSRKANTENTAFLTGDLRRLPFLDDSFELIICQSVLEHVIGVLDVIREFYRVLKKGGKVIIRVGNGAAFLNFSFLGWILRRTEEKLERPSFILRPSSVEDRRENFDTCSIPSYVLINQLKKAGFSSQFYTTFPEYVLQRDFNDLHLVKRMALKLLLKFRRFPPICYMGGTTIVMVSKGQP